MRELPLVVVLVAAGLAGCIGAEDPGSARSDDDPPPPAEATARWIARDCTGVSLVWTPPLEALGEVAGPWTPAEGPVPDRGVFVLFAVECPDTHIDGNATGPVSGGAAIVRIETPETTHGIAGDGWSAVPEHVGDPPIAELFDEHGFTVPKGSASVGVDRSPAGWGAQMTYTTPNGTIAADGGVDPRSEARDVRGALVADHADPFSVFYGPETMTRRTGQAAVEASGDTWVSRLDLEPTPFSYAVDSDFSWDFTFERDAGSGDAARAS